MRAKRFGAMEARIIIRSDIKWLGFYHLFGIIRIFLVICASLDTYKPSKDLMPLFLGHLYGKYFVECCESFEKYFLEILCKCVKKSAALIALMPCGEHRIALSNSHVDFSGSNLLGKSPEWRWLISIGAYIIIHTQYRRRMQSKPLFRARTAPPLPFCGRFNIHFTHNMAGGAHTRLA